MAPRAPPRPGRAALAQLRPAPGAGRARRGRLDPGGPGGDPHRHPPRPATRVQALARLHRECQQKSRHCCAERLHGNLISAIFKAVCGCSGGIQEEFRAKTQEAYVVLSSPPHSTSLGLRVETTVGPKNLKVRRGSSFMAKVKIPEHPLLKKLVTEKKTDVTALQGYVGPSSTPGCIRVYATLDLQRAFLQPQETVLLTIGLADQRGRSTRWL